MIVNYQLIKDVFELAVQNDMDYHGCAQSVLAALQAKLGIGDAALLKAGTALNGGMASQGETCGALIAAVMAIGCECGREHLEDVEKIQPAKGIAIQVYNRFRNEVGHSLCAEIHKIRFGRSFYLADPEQWQAFHDAGGHSRTSCPEVCGIAARIAAETILELRASSRTEF
jgi:C_GCAxxG_C_C family probable redox protein